ncbi:hypothetical protein K491DRAFT_685336 [Lophiostoma macrostomum CBS 122681]|uniref:Uncharacterized protein n=1 Tax=Lophiostoma macrostomum CBS 122681 TaxID=1314788 RepID=A0A6A6SJU5_9PLEO|nr:hypothetical protein K491DRAFT_685336 [Lophiostoma macrostomum CBS 122681]
MRLLTLFATSLALAVACPPPFNDPNFFGINDTATYIQEQHDNGTSGWADSVWDWRNIHREWPRQEGKDAKTLIEYRYYDPAYKSTFTDIVNGALKMWFDKIGVAGEKSKHSLDIQEKKYSKGVLPYCRVPKSKDDRTPIWNPDVKDDTLVIKMQAGNTRAAMATLGYLHESADPEPGRHFIAIQRL